MEGIRRQVEDSDNRRFVRTSGDREYVTGEKNLCLVNR